MKNQKEIAALRAILETMGTDHPGREWVEGYIEALEGTRALALAREAYYHATDAWAISDGDGEDGDLYDKMVLTWKEYCSFFASEDEARAAYNAGPVVRVPEPVVRLPVGDDEDATDEAIAAYLEAAVAYRSGQTEYRDGAIDAVELDMRLQRLTDAWEIVVAAFPSEEAAIAYIGR